MRDFNEDAKEMAKNGLKIAKSLGCAFHLESEFTTPNKRIGRLLQKEKKIPPILFLNLINKKSYLTDFHLTNFKKVYIYLELNVYLED